MLTQRPAPSNSFSFFDSCGDKPGFKVKKPATHPELKPQSDSKQFSAYFADLIPGFRCEEQEAE